MASYTEESGKTSTDDDDDDEYFEKIVKSVLDTATEKIRDDMTPEKILDRFESLNVLEDATKFTIRDIKEMPFTSDKNRAIRDICHSNPDLYVILKEALADSGQQGLLSDLEDMERGAHDSLKGQGHCDSSVSCALLQQLKHKKLKVSTPISEDIQEHQQYLLDKYREENKYWVNPMDEEEVYLSEMYVQPSVKRIREINEHGEMKEVKDQESPPSKLMYKDIFYSQNGGLCKNVYITGDAGVGKTTFCDQLILNWCKALQERSDENLSHEDQKLLSSYRFLFHINLRDTETETYHVKDMIKEQLLLDVAESDISDILKTERCLIVLDGLDEWQCPGDDQKPKTKKKHIPGRNTANKNCVFLTTTREWKYTIIALKNKDVDKHVEMSGIDETSSKELAHRMLDHLDRDMQTNKTVDEFVEDVHKNKLNSFLTVPVLLIQLVTLWFFRKAFSKSQLQLYCSMLELLFERSEKNLPQDSPKRSNTAVATSTKLPEYFSKKTLCNKYSELLHFLAHLAYKGLFNEHREEALIFENSTLEIFDLSLSDIELCLRCGILTQSKSYKKSTGKFKKYSFLHKKLQEYLAALYIVNQDKPEDILKTITQLCNSVETMLEMNQVWLFVAGMNPEMTSRLFEHLADVVSADERVNTYRQTVHSVTYYRAYNRLIANIQGCVFDCVLEGMNNGHHYENVCLEDFRIDDSNVCDVERLFCSDMSKVTAPYDHVMGGDVVKPSSINKYNVKSVYIDAREIDAAKVAAINGQFQQCRSLHKLHLYDYRPSTIPASTVADLIGNSRESLTVLTLKTAGFTETTAIDKLLTALSSSISKSLITIELIDIRLTHHHREQIMNSLSQSSIIRQLKLRSFDCVDHVCDCVVKIDCSAMTQLQELSLSGSMYVDNLQSLPQSVEKVEMINVELTVALLLDFARGLSQTGRIVTVKLIHVRFTGRGYEFEQVGYLLQNCPGLMLTRCEYTDRDTWGTHRYGERERRRIKWHRCTWDIYFHTSSR